MIAGRRGKLRRVAVVGTNALAQAMDGRWIYSVWRGQRAGSLLDLRSDPLARRNVLRKHPAVVKRLHARIVQFMRKQKIPDDFVAQYR